MISKGSHQYPECCRLLVLRHPDVQQMERQNRQTHFTAPQWYTGYVTVYDVIIILYSFTN